MTKEEAMTRLEACVLPEWSALPDFGLYMDQLVTYVGNCFGSMDGRCSLTTNMINNYIKGGLIERPVGKKYSRTSLAQLLMISVLKPTTSLDEMRGLVCAVGRENIEKCYGCFRALQAQTLEAVKARSEDGALQCAIEASFLQLLSGMLQQNEEKMSAAGKKRRKL